MARRGDGARSDEASLYRVGHEPWFVPADRAVVDPALRRLAEALNRLPGPWAASLEALQLEDVGSLLSRLEPSQRAHLFHDLKMKIAPRQFGPSFCQDVLARLGRAGSRDALHAANLLASPARTDLVAWIRRAWRSGGPGSDELEPARWSDSVKCLALWSGVSASAEGARALLTAAEQGWWLPPGVSVEQGESVLITARAVVTVTPDFVFPAEADAPASLSDDATASDDGELEHPDGPGEDGANATGSLPNIDETESMSTNPQVRPHDDHADLAQRLSDSLTLAQGAVQRAAVAVREGAPPSIVDLAALIGLADCCDEALTWLADQGDSSTERNVPAIRRALADLEHARAGEHERARLGALSSLIQATGRAGLDVPLAALAELIRNVLAEPAWDEDQRATVDGLVALDELVGLAAAEGGATVADPNRLMALQSQARVLPNELAVLPVAAISGQLVRSAAVSVGAPATGETDKEPEGVEEGPESAKPEPELPEPPATPQPPPVAAETLAPLERVRPVSEPTASKVAPDGPLPVDLSGLAALVAAGRFSAAHAVAAATGRPASELRALRVAALAQAVRSDTGPCAARLRTEFGDGDLAHEPLPLLLGVPALLRTALIIGDPAAGALLKAASGHLERHLGWVAEEVGVRSLKGVLLDRPLIGVLGDVTELEQRIADAGDESRARLRHRELPFKRATYIANEWLDSSSGLLGRLLIAAADDDRGAAPMVRKETQRLSRPDEVSKEIDKLDLQLRATSSKQVEGASRRNLVNLVTDTLLAVSPWLETVAALNRQAGGTQIWATAEIAAMRTAILGRQKDVLAALGAQRSHPEVLMAAAAEAASASLADTFALLDGTAKLTPGEPPADLALTVELFKVPRAELDPELGQLTAPVLDMEELLEALSADWAGALDAQMAEENYVVAAELIGRARAGMLPLSGGDPGAVTGERAEESLRTAEHRSRRDLIATATQLTAELRRARRQNELSEEQDGELTSLLKAADPEGTRRDLHQVRATLDEVAGRLPHYREEAAARLHERLDRLVRRLGPVKTDTERILSLINDGQLATAEELIYFLEAGEQMPTGTGYQGLGRFFPVVPDALPQGITAELVETARAGGRIADLDALDYSGLSSDARGTAAEALERWRLLGSTTPEERSRINEREQLLPALRLAGFEAKRVGRLTHLPRDRDRRFVEVTGLSVVGRAIVPAFGTKLGAGTPGGGLLRVLLVWGQPHEDLLMSWLDQTAYSDSVLVAYFGTMSSAARRRLAVRASRTSAPVIVLDDAALAYLAAHGARQLEQTMAITLPFAAVNPYVRRKRSLVAAEMFYGRDKERASVLDPDGTQVIFGGRGLGKSALLRDCKDRFEREAERVAVHLELTTVVIGSGGIGADAVWDQLRRDLIEADVLPEPKRNDRPGNAAEAVRAGVRAWLKEDSRRRLLVLLDECDRFFEADAPQFVETNRLKELGQSSGGHVKVVFAGLHSVQRFTKVGRNGPFSHLAQRPTVIGPLRPQHAFDLIARPLGALGFTFDDDVLVNRVLGYCSYQPFLLQMFGHRLVETMQRRRGSAEAGPPYAVTTADVEAVESDPHLKADITQAFRDTLNLDPRYNVIANVLAHHSHERGMDARLSDVELNEECLQYWKEGFARLDVEGFRAYLQEMVGLGVLAPNNDGAGWHLRSPNVLNMIGTPDDVTAELVKASSESVLEEFIALETRRLLPDGHTRWPLTAAQVDDLLGDRANQVRLVLGSAATGADLVSQTLQAVVQELGDRYHLVEPRSRRQFEDGLVDGVPGQRRIVLSDFTVTDTKPEACMESLRAAVEFRPDKPGVTRAVVFVADPATLPFWTQAFAAEEELGFRVVGLRRHNRRTLGVWALETGRFGAEDSRERLLAVTSGWPHLVERALKLASRGAREDDALDRLAQELDTPQRRAELIDEVGLTGDSSLTAVYESVRSYMDKHGSTFGDLVDAADLSHEVLDPRASVRSLVALGVFDQDDAGLFHVDPLLERAWPDRRLTLTVD